MSQFNGTRTDHFRFWNQFETKIDKSKVTKLSYLKEMIIPKARLLMNVLSWDTEGYEQAKNILSTKVWKPIELANAHIQIILLLTVIGRANPVQINEFYEKLMTNVQSLDTMGKLKEINGYAQTSIDKAPGIRANLERIDSNWHKWDFGQFVE